MSWCNSCSIFANVMGCQDVQRCAHWAHCDVTYELHVFCLPQFLEHCRGSNGPLVWRWWQNPRRWLTPWSIHRRSWTFVSISPHCCAFKKKLNILFICLLEVDLCEFCCCFVGISGCRMQVVEWRCVVDSFGSRKPGRFGGCSMAVTCWEGECEGLLDTERASSILVHKGNLDSWFFPLIESFWLRFWVKSLSWTVLGLSPFRLLKAFWRLLWPVSTTLTWKLSSSAFHNSALNLPENTHWRTKRISAVETCKNLRPSSTMTGRVCRQKVELDLWAKNKEPPQITLEIIFLCKDNTLGPWV